MFPLPLPVQKSMILVMFIISTLFVQISLTEKN